MEVSEIFIIPHENGYLLYAPLMRKVLFSEISFENKSKKELFDILLKGGVNLRTEIRNKEYIKHLPSELQLLLTRNCNLRCKYCYSSGGDSKKNLEWPVAKAAIDFTFNERFKLNEKYFLIEFTGGGEPTLNWDVFVKSVEYVKELCKKYDMKHSIYLTTNCTFNEKKLEWIINNINHVLISFDILEEIQNDQRPFADGRPTYDIVLNNIKKMDSKSFSFAIRATLTEKHVHKICDMVEFVCDSFNNIDVLIIGPVSETGRCIKTNYKSPSNHVFLKHYIDAEKIANKRGLNLKSFSNLSVNLISDTFCHAPNTCFGITPDAQVTCCQHVDSLNHPNADIFIYGKYNFKNKRYEIDLNKMHNIRKRIVNNIPECKDCFAKYHCCGGCAFTAVENTNDFFKPDFLACERTKVLIANELFKYAIKL